jgi:cystathionine beta-lyase/cystathionine gamma-synthase
VDPGLVRLSVGIETVDDIIDDLRQAFDAVEGTTADSLPA